jgi:Zn-dependent protease/predicted transcriptional regulator
MRTSIQVGRALGIPVRLHFSFLFLFPLIILTFASGPGPIGLGDIAGLALPLRYSLAAVAAFLFFLSLLLHEMSHSYVAMQYGTKIRSITLFIFGGLAMMEDLPKDPNKEWRIAIAGPLMSFAIGGTFLLAYAGITTVNAVGYEPLTVLLLSIGLLNTVLGTFNLIPAFPMDGGRVLRAFFAKRMQFLKATKRAVFVGKTFAVIMAVVGFMPDPFILYSTGTVRLPFNPWLTLVAIFLYMAATEEERATITFATLEGIRVKNVMRTGNASVLEDLPLTALVEKMLAEKNAEYTVVNENGDVRGLVTFSEIRQLSPEQRYPLRVSDVLRPFDRLRDVIAQEAEAIEALKRMISTKTGALAVEGEERGEIIGIVTKRDLALFIEMLRGRG